LLDSHGVISRSNLNINDVQVASLLALYSVGSLVERTELQSNVMAQHMHPDLEVEARSHVDSEVVRFQDLMRAQDVRIYLDKRIIVE
jgi:hypothetical protein